MKNLFLFCIAFAGCILPGCHKDPVVITPVPLGSCNGEISENSEAHFHMDAIELALRRTAQDTTSSFYNNPQIDEDLKQHILGKLSAIYNAASDSFITAYDVIYSKKIHCHYYSTFNDLYIKFADSTLEQEFLSNPGATSYPTLNAVTSYYGFNLVSEFNGYYFLHSNDYFNIPALCNKLVSDPRVMSASPNTYCCDGDNIQYSWTDQYDEFVFMEGLGDCPSGCFGYHCWKFQVDKDCNVSLIEEYDIPG